MINFPNQSDRLAYVLSPWTDDNGRQWRWNTGKTRWDAYNPDRGLPAGGDIGQALVKRTAAPYDSEWQTLTPVDVGAMHRIGTAKLRFYLSAGVFTADLVMYPHEYDTEALANVEMPDQDTNYPRWFGATAAGNLYAVYMSSSWRVWILESFTTGIGRWMQSAGTLPWGTYDRKIEGMVVTTSTGGIIDILPAYKSADDAAVVHNTGNETVAGTKTFSTGLALTAHTEPVTTSVLSRGIEAWNRHSRCGMKFGPRMPEAFWQASGDVGGSVTYTASTALFTFTNAPAGSYRYANWANVAFPAGNGVNFSARSVCSGKIVLIRLEDSTMAVRVIVGADYSVVKTCADQPFAAKKAIGFEIYMTGGNYYARILSLATDGGTVSATAGVLINTGAIYDRTVNFVLENTGTGTINLWIHSQYINTTTPLPVPVFSAPTVTATGGPTGNGGGFGSAIDTVVCTTTTDPVANTDTRVVISNVCFEFI